jgi:TetR/AcrR family transcriptional regulator
MPRPDQAVDCRTRQLILDCATALFAGAGFAGVSMRDIARAVGITPGALYHHFPDKQALHLEAMRHAYSRDVHVRREALAPDGTPEQRLERYVAAFAKNLESNTEFRQLMQRELLDGDETRLRLLTEDVLGEQFNVLVDLAKSLSPGLDPHLLAMSIIGLVMYQFESASLRQLLPGYRAEHDNPDVLSRHVLRLLLHGVRGTA